MRFEHHESLGTVNISKLIDAFETIDNDATGKTYNKSTADFSRDHLDDPSLSQRDALEEYLQFWAEELVIAYDGKDVVGFTTFATNDPQFLADNADKMPFIAVTYSGVLPSYQRQGIWTKLRKKVEEIARDRPIDYILTGTGFENEASQEANKSLGYSIIGSTDEYDAGTHYHARRI